MVMQDLFPRQYSGLSSSPPSRHVRTGNHPTLLVSWFCTGCAIVIILLRVGGRYVRTERLFKEDKIMFWSLVPLLIRMALIHVVLLYGTNNVTTQGLTPLDIDERTIGSKLVLATRIFYAMFIWMSKWTISEFLKRLTVTSWNRTYEIVLRAIRGFLVATFVGIVIATLAECHPFSHYWQVIPDPGPSCREDYAQVLVMSISDVLTDLALVAFPIPIILGSGFAVKRKISLTLLFMTSLILVPITIIRVITIIDTGGRQQKRSLWASIEILAAAAVANVVVLGSFVRDRGVKKVKKYRADPLASVHSEKPSISRRMTAQHWGNDSDTDLFRAIGGRLSSVVAEIDEEAAMQNRQVASMANLDAILGQHALNEKDSRNFDGSMSAGTSSQGSDAALLSSKLREQTRLAEEPNLPEARNANNAALADFFRQGPPLGADGQAATTTVTDFARRPSLHIDPLHGRRGSGLSFVDAGGLLPTPPARKGSTVSFADDVGGVLRSTTPNFAYHRPSVVSSNGTGVSPTTARRQSRLPSIIDSHAVGRALHHPSRNDGSSDLSLNDPGGLLGPSSRSPTPAHGRSTPGRARPVLSTLESDEMDFADAGGLLGPPRSPTSPTLQPRHPSDPSQEIGRAISPSMPEAVHMPGSPTDGRNSDPEAFLSRRRASGSSPPPSNGWSRRFNFSPGPPIDRSRRDSQVRKVSGPQNNPAPHDMEFADAGGLLGVSE